MNKFLRFLLLAVLLAPMGARAETDTLTVAEGTATNSYLPVYGYWADADQHNQMIYPASMLDSMVGQNIIGLHFYTSGGWSVSNAVVRMAVVSDSTLTGLNTSATFVDVWSGPLTAGTIDLAFGNAFAYSGGHLLIDIQTTGGSFSSSSSEGISRNNAGYYSYNGYGYTQNFLPKADFVYSDEAFCNAPTGVTFDGAIGGSLSFHWTPGGTEASWEVMVGDSLIQNVSDTFITVWELNPSSRYNVSVRAICGVGDTSVWTGATVMLTECAGITGTQFSVIRKLIVQ